MAGTEAHPFESDDEDDDRHAEEFEEAYNLRFERSEGLNQKLVSHARDTAAKLSVRKEARNKRKRARELEQSLKEATKTELLQEKARLRKLRLEEAEARYQLIKDAAGLNEGPFDVHEWFEFLTEDWDDQKWEAEMIKRFGNQYYAEREPGNCRRGKSSKKQRASKPKWQDDIDITDIVHDYDGSDGNDLLSQEEAEDEVDKGGDEVGDVKFSNAAVRKSDKGKRREKTRTEDKREVRRERQRVQNLVDTKLTNDLALEGVKERAKTTAPFRYRDTSPQAYGLTAWDILMASDGQLNQYAGLKKFASFRDPAKKKKDKKQLGRKARLRQWRMQVFGSEADSQKSLHGVSSLLTAPE